MAFPPATYFLLVGVTLLLGPFIMWHASSPAGRRFSGRVLLGLLLFESGLVLLFYAKILCWPLVALGVAVIGSASATPRRVVPMVLVLLGAGFLGGLGFEILQGARAFYVYFGFAVPLLLLSGTVAAVAPFLRSWKPRRVAAAAMLLLFGALTPASAFGYTFLESYEVHQLPVLLVALAGIHVLARDKDSAPRLKLGDTLAARLSGAYAGAGGGGAFVLAGLAVGFWALRHAPLPAPLAVLAVFLVAVAALVAVSVMLWRPDPRLKAPLLVGSAMVGALAGLMGLRFGAQAFHTFVGGGPAPETVLFYLAGVGLLFLALAGAFGLAWARERGRYDALANEPRFFVHEPDIDAGALPAGFELVTRDRMPGVAALQAFRETMQANGRPGGVIVVAEQRDPLGGLPPQIEDWLAVQREPPYVHVAVREGREVFLVPFIDPEEAR